MTIEGVEATLFARDPLVRNPCAITFDSQGRVTVGMGPQYRKPEPDTPPDSVYILTDTDGDGEADRRHLFAAGFNSIQGLLWGELGLYVANAPDFTLVRDLDGDDVGDQYIKLFVDLGNLEHGLHGLNWGPDGRLYMSKGNSKGLSIPPDRIAPKPFRDLWGVEMDGVPDTPLPRVYSAAEYARDYHDPDDDWGRQGGVLRCDPDGGNLEIVASGMRNPWDMAFDNDFNTLATDNDQTLGDKFIAPFEGAHFGWGHAWSSDWEGRDHLPTVPASGPLFEGSGTGVTWWDVPGMPDSFRGVFLVNDWLQRQVYVYRPSWDGALMVPENTPLTVLATAGSGRDMKSSSGRSFDPVDIEVGPDGAVYISSWGREYGARFKGGELVNEGRIYRVMPSMASVKPGLLNRGPQVMDQLRLSGIRQLVRLLDEEWLPVRLRLVQQQLIDKLSGTQADPGMLLEETLSRRASTWLIHALALSGHAPALVDSIRQQGNPIDAESIHRVIQILKSSAGRTVLLRDHPEWAATLLTHPDARLRHHMVLAVAGTGDSSFRDALWQALESESDRVVFYSLWRALQKVCDPAEITENFRHHSAPRRLGALLASLESGNVSAGEVRLMMDDPDPRIAALARKWAGGGDGYVIRGRPLPQSGGNQKKGPVGEFSRPQVFSRNGGGTPQWVPAAQGSPVYVDRRYQIRSLPRDLEGASLLQTANQDDRNPQWRLLLKFEDPSRLVVAHDARIHPRHIPEWLREFKPTGQTVVTDDTSFRLYARPAGPGVVQLGPNVGDTDPAYALANYFVIVAPGASVAEDTADDITLTRSTEVLPLLAGADPDRGRSLFLSADRAACAVCHQLEGIGNAHAPDLAGIGSRSTPDFIIESILDPDAAVTEGFHQVALTGVDGGVVSGIILNETGRNITMALLNGDRLVVDRDEVESRETLPVSAMPSHFAAMLSPQDVADITAYLIAPEDRSPAPPPQSWSFVEKEDHAEIRYGDKSVMTYWMRHPSMSRPGFANVHSLQGRLLTRGFPAGEEADHRFMHPGLSISYGWLDGHDYWRMKAPVEHLVFTHPATVSEDGQTLRFGIKNRYRHSDGVGTVCYEVMDITLVAAGDRVLMQWDVSYYNDDRAFDFGDQEESGLAIRIADDLRVRGGSGVIESSHGGVNEAGTWGKAFDWIAYSGLRDGRRLGIGIHPDSVSSGGCWAHSRNYGVLVANPFPRQPQGRREPYVRTTVQQFSLFHLNYRLVLFDIPASQEFSPALFE